MSIDPSRPSDATDPAVDRLENLQENLPARSRPTPADGDGPRPDGTSIDEPQRATLRSLAQSLPRGRSLRDELRRAREADLVLIGPEDPGYPDEFRCIAGAPRFIYRRGAPIAPLPRIAMVGSRRASAAGERCAHRMGRALSEAGWCVVSGLARGVDRAALDGAVVGGTAAIAVLGNGLPTIYPPENAGLSDRIVRSGGQLLTEWPCGAPPRRSHFPRRNRLISALARAVLVVEATERSGSLITATWALEQGREVLVVPGPVEGPRHAGCHRLIREGATLVTGPDQVLEALDPLREAAPPVPSGLRRAFEAGVRDLALLLETTRLPPARLLEGWRRLLAEESERAAPPDESRFLS